MSLAFSDVTAKTELYHATKKTSRRFPQILTSYMAKFKSFKANGVFREVSTVSEGPFRRGFRWNFVPRMFIPAFFWFILGVDPSKEHTSKSYIVAMDVPSLTIAVFQGHVGLSSHVRFSDSQMLRPSAELGTYLDTSTLLAICLCWSTCHWHLQDGILGPEICGNGWVMSLQVMFNRIFDIFGHIIFLPQALWPLKHLGPLRQW